MSSLESTGEDNGESRQRCPLGDQARIKLLCFWKWTPLPQAGKAVRHKPVNPIFNSPGRVAEKLCRVIGTGAMEDIKDDIKSVKVSSLPAPGYFVLNGSDKCLCIKTDDPLNPVMIP